MWKHLAVLGAVTAAACGGSSSSSSSAASNARTLNSLSQQVSSAAETYGTQAGMMMDHTACTADESTYDAQVRPMVEQMVSMGPAMDGQMSAMGLSADADMACGAAAMMAELDRHQAAACLSMSDMTPNMAEASMHVTTMTEWSDHQLVRSYAMGSGTGMGMGGMGGGSMSTGHCVHNGDGTYTLE